MTLTTLAGLALVLFVAISCGGGGGTRLDTAEAAAVPAPSDPSLLPEVLRPLVEQATEACRRSPDDAPARLDLARLYHANGQSLLARRCYEQAVALGANDARSHYLLGLLLAQEGQARQALASFERGLSSARGYPPLHFHRGRVLRDLGRLPEAIESFRQAASLAPGEASHQAGLGAALRQAGRLEEAEVSLRSALALDPRAAEAHHLLGLVLLARGRPEDADEHLSRGGKRADTLASDPWLAEVQERAVLPEVLLDRAEAYLDHERIQQAISLLEGLAATHPSSAAVQLLLGRARLARGEEQGAVDAFTRASRLDPRGAAAHAELAETLHRHGMRDAAEREADLALAADPQNLAALITKAAVEVEREHGEAALRIIEGVLARREDLPQAHIILGEALSQRNDLERAAAAYSRAADLSPDSEYPRRRLGLTYLKLGRREAARRELEQARRLDPTVEPTRRALEQLGAGADQR